MIERWGHFVARRPVWVLVGLGLLTAFFGAFVPGIDFQSDMSEMLPTGDPVVRRLEETEDLFGSQNMLMVGVEAPAGGTLFTLESVRKVFLLTEELKSLKGEGLVEEVISPTHVNLVEGTELALVIGPALSGPPETEGELRDFRDRILSERQVAGSLVTPDGSAFAILLQVAPDVAADQVLIGRIMDRVHELTSRFEGPERFYVAGDAAMTYYIQRYMRQDLVRLLPIVMVVVLIVLSVSFRQLRGVVLPLGVVILAVIWTVGLMVLTGTQLTIITTFVPVLLVAVGSAYGIHVISDYYERARAVEDREELVVQVVRAMAAPVFAAALTTAAGFFTLLSAFLVPIREFGLFSAAGVLFSFLISLSLVPAVLALLPRSRRPAEERGLDWPTRAARLLPGRERVVAAVALLVFGALLALAPRLEVESDMAKYFRSSSPVVQGLKFLEEKFGYSTQLSVVVDTGRRDGVKDPEVLAFMDELAAFLEGQGSVGDTSSLVDTLKETNFSLHGDDAGYYALPDSARAVAQMLLLYELGGGEVLRSQATRDFTQAQIIARVKSVGTREFSRLKGAVEEFIARNAPPGITAYLTGPVDLYLRVSNRIVQSQIVSLFAGFGVVGLIVAVLLGSWVAGALALTPLVLSVVGNFGTMVLTGIPLDIATAMIASLVVGIGVDYSVHFIVRYRRERVRGVEPSEALKRTYVGTGRAILCNAATLVFGFCVLVFSSFQPLGTLGWLVALTMITSAMGALLIIPAILGLASPSFLTRRVVLVRSGRGFRLTRQVADPPEQSKGKRQRS